MNKLSKLRFWAWPSELRRAGVLGINRRNLNYIFPENPRRLYPRVDDKALSKRIFEAAGIPVAETYATIRSFGEIASFDELVKPWHEFVIKPVCGAGGRGVMVVCGRRPGAYVTANGDTRTGAEVRYHISGILSGLHSLAGHPDTAMIEQRINIHPVFQKIAVNGTPDIRVLLHYGAPVMAMIRLPTRASAGRANLHQGAVGAGIDFRSGCTAGGVHNNRAVSRHPDTGAELRGVAVPEWERVLSIARQAGEAVGMGYLGIDLVLDVDRGPLVLEANARPGLAIQIANGAGIEARLDASSL